MIKKVLQKFGRQLILAWLFSWSVLAQAPLPDQGFKLNYLEPANYLVEDIRIVGTKELEPEALLATLDIRVGDLITLPGPTIDEVIKKMWQQKLVKDVNVYVSQVTPKSIVLTIDIVESPRLSKYTFEGIKRRDIKVLQEIIHLEKGKIVTNQLLRNTQKTLQEKLVSQGYLNAQVDLTSFPDPELPDYMQVKIKIVKGEKFIINQILVKGNDKISSEVLKAQLEHVKEKARFTLVKDILQKTFTLQPFKKGGILWRQPSLEETFVYLKTHIIPFSSKFIKANYEKDKKNLIDYYRTQGYRDATMVADSVYKQGEGRLNIVLQIEEGKQYRFGKISWVGNYLYEDELLKQVLNIKRGSIYNPTLLQTRLLANPTGKDIASLYMDNGYLFFQAEPVEVKVEDHQVDIEIRIQEGVEATINQVNIKGNTLTYDHVIRRELKTLPGDKFSRAKVQRSLRELTMLNIFDPAIGFFPIPNPADNTVDLNYEVKENPKFDIKATGGWGGNSAISFSLALGGNNLSLRRLLYKKRPLGDGQTINLKAEFQGFRYQDFSLQFLEPWFGGKKPTALSFTINKSFQKATDDSFLSSFGIRSGLGTRLKWPDDYFILRSGLNYARYNYKDYTLIEGKGKRRGTMHEVSFNTTIERNSLNDPIYPTGGSEIGLHIKLTPPYSLLFTQKGYNSWPIQQKYKWKEYHQWILDASYFQKLFGDWVVNVRAHGGIVGGYSVRRGVGPFERFTMGGSGLAEFSLLSQELIKLRGYPDEYILPHDTKRGYKGGTIFDKLVFEIRHPLVKSSMVYIYALAFAEAGNTWLNVGDWRPFDLKSSTGVGLRIHSPVGIIGLDWGYGFDQTGVDKVAFQWSLGASIR
jgi:outer membrane protein insertion porin family